MRRVGFVILMVFAPYGASAQLGDFALGMQQSAVQMGSVLTDQSMTRVSERLLADQLVDTTTQSLQLGSLVETSYRPSSTIAVDTRRDLLNRVGQSNSAAARTIAAEFARQDPRLVYTNIVAPFGLRRGDVADSMTAYTLLAWMIATGESDPNRARVAAVRAHVAGELGRNPAVASAANRQRMDEELMMLFVIMHAGWQSAQRENTLQAYSDGVNAMFAKQFGRNLRKLVLTDAGFRDRG